MMAAATMMPTTSRSLRGAVGAGSDRVSAVMCCLAIGTASCLLSTQLFHSDATALNRLPNRFVVVINGRTSDQHIRASFHNEPRSPGMNATIHLQIAGGAHRINHRAQPTQLGYNGDEVLAAKARVDGHCQHQIERSEEHTSEL